MTITRRDKGNWMRRMSTISSRGRGVGRGESRRECVGGGVDSTLVYRGDLDPYNMSTRSLKVIV